MHWLTLLPLFLVAQLPAVTAEPAAPACIGCRADLEQIRNGYSADQWMKLTHGDVVTSKVDRAGSEGAAQSDVEASVIVPYPPALVWAVVTDFESRPKFVPGAKDVRVVRVEGERIWVAEHLRVLFVNIHFTVISTLEPELGSVTWVLDPSAEHDIADTRGSWQVVPLTDGRETLLRYRAWIKSGRAVPGFIESFLTKRSLPKVVEGLRAEVRRRFPLLREETFDR